MSLRRLPMVALMFVFSGCTIPHTPSPFLTEEARALNDPSAPIRWRADPKCLVENFTINGDTRGAIADKCTALGYVGAHDLVVLAFSGGGTKAAVFGGESLFYLDALGLLSRTSVISSVSGGSFPAAYYVLSCDPNDKGCDKPIRGGLKRPQWQYSKVMTTLATGYDSLVKEQVIRILVPFVPINISGARFAEYIDENFFRTDPGDRFRFKDLNPRRPYLILNATIVSENRAEIDETSCSKRELHQRYLRRRTPDEFFHFAFTDFYFKMINTAYEEYPLSYGIAASAAFPPLIDYLDLEDHCRKGEALRLLDGGINDN